MSFFKSGNPTLSEKRFKDTILDNVVSQENAMTVKGTMQKFGILFLLTIATAFYSWKEAAGNGDSYTLALVGAFGGLGIAILFMFKKEWGAFLAPAYAICEGLFVGTVSAYFEYAVSSNVEGYYSGGYSGIVAQAVGLTFCVVVSMYLLYKFNIIRPTKLFKSVIITATCGVALFYLISSIAYYGFDQAPPSFVFQGTPLGIGFSLFVVALAALNLILDFDMIETAAETGAPKYMEWYGAFGLLVTIVWLYLEILRLLSKLRD